MTVSTKLTVLAGLMALSMASASAETLRVGLQDDPDTLDPATGGTYTGRIVFAALCDKLVDINDKLEIVPQLATEWSWNDSNTELTLKLRQGVTFHDGTPFDAAAVKANIERMQTLKESKRHSELSPIKTVEVVDPTTVVLKLEDPVRPAALGPHRPRGHDGVAVSRGLDRRILCQAGVFRSVSVREPQRARQDHPQEVPRLLERRRDRL